MASKCLDEFNPWPSFVDIFSAVILVLLLFLLVLIVNIGYYAQFKFKVQYDGSVATDKIILDDSAKIVKIIKEQDKEQQETESLLQTTNMEKVTTQAMQEYLTAATDIESAGEDLADKKKNEKEQTQNLLEKDRIFYIKFNENEVFIEQQVIEKLKLFIKKAREKYPSSKVSLSSIDPTDQVSLTVTKQISLGRILSARTLLKKFEYESKDIKLKLSEKQIIPEEIETESGLIVVKIIL
jgi:hypothetical protein